MKGKYKILTVIILQVVLFCLAIQEAYGWQSLGQNAKNESFVESNTSPVELYKLERDEDGTATEIGIPNTAFYLFTKDGEQIGARYITDKDGKILVKLEPGEYYFEEVSPAPGFDYDKDDGNRKTTYPFTVAEKSKETVVVKAYNTRIKGSLLIQKIVKNDDESVLSSAQKDASFTFTVTFSDKGTYSYKIDDGDKHELKSGETLSLKHGQTAIFSDIPEGVLYHVTETPIPGYTMTSTDSQGTISEEGKIAFFINTYHPSRPGSLSITKTVTGDGADKDKEFTFKAIINGHEETFTLKHGETHTIADLPEGTRYTVVEEDYTVNGYFTGVNTYTGVILSEQETVLPFENHYGETDEPGNLEIQKEVIGEKADAKKEFTFKVTFSEKNSYAYRIDGGELQTLGEDGILKLKAGQKAVFENLKKGITYVAKEVNASGYYPLMDELSGTIIGGQTSVARFQNKVSEVQEEATLSVTKLLDGEYPKSHEEKKFHFTLILNGERQEFDLKHRETKDFTVHLGDTYEVLEDDYFAENYSVSVIEGHGTIASEHAEAFVTNTYIGEPLTEIKVEKIWNLQGADKNVIPSSIKLQLKQGDTLVEEKEIKPDKNDKWEHTFTAPKYDKDGNLLVYHVAEVPVESFKTAYKETEDATQIINTYLEPIEVDPPVVKKIVKGEDAPDRKFIFLMKGEDNAPMPEGSIGNTKTMAIDGSGEAEFGYITFTKPGTYTYSVYEMDNETQGWHYDTASYSIVMKVTEKDGKLHAERTIKKENKDADGIEFTNTYDKNADDEKVTLSGTKTWKHGDNPKSKWPTSIIVKVYANKKLLLQQQVSAENKWAYSFTLPKYDEDGVKIQYTIDEQAVKDYKTTIDGFNITNTYDPKSDDPDKPSESNKPGGSNKPSGGNNGIQDGIRPGGNPSTGDTTNLKIYLILICFSEVILIALLRQHRRIKKSMRSRH